jgi:hypothetical protein
MNCNKRDDGLIEMKVDPLLKSLHRYVAVFTIHLWESEALKFPE